MLTVNFLLRTIFRTVARTQWRHLALTASIRGVRQRDYALREHAPGHVQEISVSSGRKHLAGYYGKES